MATQVQRRRGTTTEHASFTGADGELTVDTTKQTVVVHDGTTAGGTPLAREDLSNVSLSITDADVAAGAAIAGSKISPDFGSQTVTTTGVFSADDGTAAAPGITFTGDTNTGIYSPGADQVAISTGGTGRLFVDSSGRMGIGAPAPANNLHIAGSSNVTLRIEDTTGSYSTFNYNDSGTTSAFTLSVDAGNTGADSSLRFSIDGFERLRITSDGKVGIGATLPAQQLHVLGSGAAIRVDNSDAGANVYGDILSNVGGTLSIRSRGGASTHGSISLNTWDGTTDATRLFIDGSGYVRLASGTGGIQFNGDTAAANALDDYEEGTWTPVVADASTGGNTGTTSAAVGTYTKVGRLVTLNLFLQNINTTGMTAANSLFIRGTPFAARNEAAAIIVYSGAVTANDVTVTTPITSDISDNTSYVRIRKVNSGAPNSLVLISDLTSGSADIYITITYEAAS